MHILAALTVASVLTTGYAQSPPGFTPVTSQHLSVVYGSVDVTSAGVTLSGPQTADAPELAYNGTDDGATYLAIMVDIDLKIPRPSSSLVHWLLPGLRSSSKDGGQKTLKSDENALAPYLGPSPPAGQTHRYALFLYSQPASFSVPADYAARFNNITASVVNRVGFELANFTAEAGLGAAVAANWFFVGTPASAASSSVSASASVSPSGSGSTSPKATTGLVSAASLCSMNSVLATVAMLSAAFLM